MSRSPEMLLPIVHIPRELGIGAASAILCLIVVLGLSTTAIYRLWFHPLSTFPGPIVLAITGLPAAWKSYVSGTFARDMPALHRQYGPAVRIGPNHIALDGSIGWPQVYARRPEFGKYLNYLLVEDHQCLLGAPRDVHRRQRRQLGHAFSDASLAEQERFIKKHVDVFMARMEEHVEAGRDLNIVEWLNFTTFDVVSDLTFSSTFGNLEGSAYHPWVVNFFRAIRGEALLRFIRFYPLMRPIVALVGRRNIKVAYESREDSMTKALERMGLGEKPEGSERKDMTEYMMRKNRDGHPGMSDMETLMNSLILVGAGSETTATALSGFFFYVGTAPEAYRILTGEIRAAFETEEEITMKSAARLPYLQACIDEQLRVYPPAAETPPRVSPGVEIDGRFVPKGTWVSVYQWATFRNPDNFADPDAFCPQRWLPATHPLYETRFAGDNKASFRPFSQGPRDCIGKNLAYAEMRVILARLLWRFDFELLPGQESWHDKQPTFLVWEKGPLRVRLTRREC